LYTESEATFDDVSVYGRSLPADLLFEHRMAEISQGFTTDRKALGEWASPRDDWQPMPEHAEFRRNRWEFFGDHWMTVPIPALKAGNGALTLILNGDGQDPGNGFRAVLEQAAEGLRCTIYRDGKPLAAKGFPALHAGEAYSVRFSRKGDRCRIELDGDLLLETRADPLPGRLPAFGATGCFAGTEDVLVLGERLLDYAFADAPVDWLTEGTWMATTRWACSNQWSFLGGWSRGDAVLWHKARFSGDQSFEAFMAPKMEYPRETQNYWERFRDMGIVICGDGHNPRLGYTAICGTSEFGMGGKKTVLLRNGAVVGTADIGGYEAIDTDAHTGWLNLELRKRGKTVELWVEGRKAISFTDNDPLEGGVPGVLAVNNGIAVARVRIACANPPVPRTDPLVTLDDPWYPAWANVGRPLTLEFPRSYATSGRPVTLAVEPREVPTAEKAVPEVKGSRVTITPQVSGNHWYRVTATDDATRSPAFHITLPVYDPARGRDDSHALVLYRFDEGQGNVIKDHGQGAPADLVIPDGAPVEWLPGQGITQHGLGRIMTKDGAAKLMAIAKTNACSFEFWIAPDTLHPPTWWLAGLLAWELPNEQRNITVSHFWASLAIAPHGATYCGNAGGAVYGWGPLDGLRHVMVTWDGAVTRCYIDGNEMQQFHIPWHTDAWNPAAPLLLGSLAEGEPNYHEIMANFGGISLAIMPNRPEMQHCFLGSFYLAAIHDRCFSADEVKRHYEAGPSAR